MPLIPGATAISYELQPEDVGFNIFCRVRGTNAAGFDIGQSNTVGPVASSATLPSIVTAPAVTVAVDGASVTCDTGIWDGTAPITYGYQWFSDEEPDVAISGATSATYVIDGGVIEPPELTVPTTNLWSHLKSDMGTFSDAAMTTPSVPDGGEPTGNVAGWQDQSPTGTRHWTQSSGTIVKPNLRTAQVNGLPAINFLIAGTFGNHLVGPSMMTLTEGEIFIVIKADEDPSLTGAGHWDMSADTSTNYYNFVDGNIYEGWGSTTRRLLVDPAPPITNWRLYNIVSTASEYTAFLDGTQVFTTATNTVGFNAAPLLGAANDGAPYIGDIAEVIIYSAKLSAPDKAAVEAYVAARYALTIA